ncbi:MAG TPA: 23S rRNA pseudouridine(1911/1915/1917) synthase RluD, partial [Nevskiales bacterium]|nr:23S rRNA pseudouridine(1911/1915/1917) synthase RluD [Nevskiales bacterium]
MAPGPTSQIRDLTVPPELAGQRLDRVLAELLPDYSRSRLQHWIEDGRVTLEERLSRPREKVAAGQRIQVRVEAQPAVTLTAQDMPLDIVYEDDALLVIDKPPGLVVHPGAGNPDGTLLNALLHHAPELVQVPRAGIVHRIDKDTSGLLVVARTLAAHAALVRALAARAITREYEAVVCGVLTAGGTVDQPIGRDERDRTRMRVKTAARAAVTHYRVLERFRAHTHLRLTLETGRTHQIRVHMQYLRHPLVGDPVYGRRLGMPAGAGESLRAVLAGFRRQALHARRLGLVHPLSGTPMEWQAP